MTFHLFRLLLNKKNLRKKGTNLENFNNIQQKINKNLFKKKYKLIIFEKMIECQSSENDFFNEMCS